MGTPSHASVRAFVRNSLLNARDFQPHLLMALAGFQLVIQGTDLRRTID